MPEYLDCRTCRSIKCFRPFKCLKAHAYNPFKFMQHCPDYEKKQPKSTGADK